MASISFDRKGVMLFFNTAKKKGQLTVPFHGSKEVKKGLLNAILSQAEIKQNR